MSKASLSEIVKYADRLLKIGEIEDYKGARNGLQVENRGGVSRIAAMVDASRTTVRLAAQSGAGLMLVHHGLFWGPACPWTGSRYQLLRDLLDNDLAVYSAHLPLDLHPKYGNNALLCRALGLKQLEPFFEFQGRPIGYQCGMRIHRDQLRKKLETALNGPVHLAPGGPKTCRNIGVVTGGAGGELHQALQARVDTFITGEGPHWSYAAAEDMGVNVFYGGHYATETFGVKALAKHLAAKFGLQWEFIDHPTGL